jgi:hypothetical protein
MKKFAAVSLFVMVSLVFASLASAQTGVPGSGWWSGEQIQNVGDQSGTVVLTAYDSQSPATYDEQKSLGPGEAYTFTPFTEFADMPDGFIGSAVASADVPIKGIVNVSNQEAGPFGTSGGKAVAQYQGTDGSAVADTLYFPLAKGDHFGKTTSFYIQNAGSAEATDVSGLFTMRNGDTHTVDLPSIGLNQMVVFSVHDATTYAPTENDGKVGGLVVTDDQPLAGVVMEHDTTGNPAVVLNGTRGFVSADFNDTAYAPVIKHDRFDRFTGLQVQNVSGGDIDITVTYKGTAGTCAGSEYTDSATAVPDGEAKTFVHLGSALTNLPADCTASATVEATGDFVAIVNEQEVPGSGADKAGITYSAIGSGSVTTKVSAPLFKDARFGATTGLQIQNVGSAEATTWTATFTCKADSDFVAVSDSAKTGAIPAGGAFLFYRPSTQDLFTSGSPFQMDGANCAVVIESDQPIVAIANEMTLSSASVQLDDNNYEGFNLTP